MPVNDIKAKQAPNAEQRIQAKLPSSEKRKSQSTAEPVMNSNSNPHTKDPQNEMLNTSHRGPTKKRFPAPEIRETVNGNVQNIKTGPNQTNKESREPALSVRQAPKEVLEREVVLETKKMGIPPDDVGDRGNSTTGMKKSSCSITEAETTVEDTIVCDQSMGSRQNDNTRQSSSALTVTTLNEDMQSIPVEADDKMLSPRRTEPQTIVGALQSSPKVSLVQKISVQNAGTERTTNTNAATTALAPPVEHVRMELGTNTSDLSSRDQPSDKATHHEILNRTRIRPVVLNINSQSKPAYAENEPFLQLATDPNHFQSQPAGKAPEGTVWDGRIGTWVHYDIFKQELGIEYAEIPNQPAKEPLQQREDGTYVRPDGPGLKGYHWDELLGVWRPLPSLQFTKLLPRMSEQEKRDIADAARNFYREALAQEPGNNMNPMSPSRMLQEKPLTSPTNIQKMSLSGDIVFDIQNSIEGEDNLLSPTLDYEYEGSFDTSPFDLGINKPAIRLGIQQSARQFDTDADFPTKPLAPKNNSTPQDDGNRNHSTLMPAEKEKEGKSEKPKEKLRGKTFPFLKSPKTNLHVPTLDSDAKRNKGGLQRVKTKVPTNRNDDGTYMRPRGRAPAGKCWDKVLGKWVAEENTVVAGKSDQKVNKIPARPKVKRPQGRPPSGKRWDKVRGEWVPEDSSEVAEKTTRTATTITRPKDPSPGQIMKRPQGGAPSGKCASKVSDRPIKSHFPVADDEDSSSGDSEYDLTIFDPPKIHSYDSKPPTTSMRTEPDETVIFDILKAEKETKIYKVFVIVDGTSHPRCLEAEISPQRKEREMHNEQPARKPRMKLQRVRQRVPQFAKQGVSDTQTSDLRDADKPDDRSLSEASGLANQLPEMPEDEILLDEAERIFDGLEGKESFSDFHQIIEELEKKFNCFLTDSTKSLVNGHLTELVEGSQRGDGINDHRLGNEIISPMPLQEADNQGKQTSKDAPDSENANTGEKEIACLDQEPPVDSCEASNVKETSVGAEHSSVSPDGEGKEISEDAPDSENGGTDEKEISCLDKESPVDSCEASNVKERSVGTEHSSVSPDGKGKQTFEDAPDSIKMKDADCIEKEIVYPGQEPPLDSCEASNAKETSVVADGEEHLHPLQGNSREVKSPFVESQNSHATDSMKMTTEPLHRESVDIPDIPVDSGDDDYEGGELESLDVQSAKQTKVDKVCEDENTQYSYENEKSVKDGNDKEDLCHATDSAVNKSERENGISLTPADEKNIMENDEEECADLCATDENVTVSRSPIELKSPSISPKMSRTAKASSESTDSKQAQVEELQDSNPGSLAESLEMTTLTVDDTCASIVDPGQPQPVTTSNKEGDALATDKAVAQESESHEPIARLRESDNAPKVSVGNIETSDASLESSTSDEPPEPTKTAQSQILEVDASEHRNDDAAKNNDAAHAHLTPRKLRRKRDARHHFPIRRIRPKTAPAKLRGSHRPGASNNVESGKNDSQLPKLPSHDGKGIFAAFGTGQTVATGSAVPDVSMFSRNRRKRKNPLARKGTRSSKRLRINSSVVGGTKDLLMDDEDDELDEREAHSRNGENTGQQSEEDGPSKTPMASFSRRTRASRGESTNARLPATRTRFQKPSSTKVQKNNDVSKASSQKPNSAPTRERRPRDESNGTVDSPAPIAPSVVSAPYAAHDGTTQEWFIAPEQVAMPVPTDVASGCPVTEVSEDGNRPHDRDQCPLYEFQPRKAGVSGVTQQCCNNCICLVCNTKAKDCKMWTAHCFATSANQDLLLFLRDQMRSGG